MSDAIDPLFFQDLAEQNPTDVCKRAMCSYDDKKNCYAISIWGDHFSVYPDRSMIESGPGNQNGPYPYFDLFVVHYLLTAKEIEPSNQWVSEKDIPGGAAFFRGPHEIPTRLIAARFEDDIHGFSKRCEQLMGQPLPMADAAFVFHVAPRVPVAVLFWLGDDEFSAESKILFDRTIKEHLALDIIYALAVGVCERLGKK